MADKKSSIRFITRTAILLALTIVFQTIGRAIPLGQFNQFITGSLVNACLLIAAALCAHCGHWQFYTGVVICIDQEKPDTGY